MKFHYRPSRMINSHIKQMKVGQRRRVTGISIFYCSECKLVQPLGKLSVFTKTEHIHPSMYQFYP